MKDVKFQSKKPVSTKQHRASGMKVRSGVKAGRHYGELGRPGVGGMHDFEPEL